MSGDLTDRMLHLRQVPVGALLSPPLLRLLATSMTKRTLVAGETLLSKGTLFDALVLLAEGTVILSRDGQLLQEMKAPQTIGFLGILARQEAPYDAVAATPVEAWEIETDTLLEVFEEHFEFLVTTLRYLAERLYFDLQDLPEQALGMPPTDLGVLPEKIDIFDRVLAMRKMSGFADASIIGLEIIARQMELFEKPAGTQIFAAGDPPERVIFLLEGTIECRTRDGRRFEYGPGTGVGGLECLAEKPRWYTATTKTSIRALRGKNEDLLDVFEHQHRMAMDFVAMLARAGLGLLQRRPSSLATPRDVSSMVGVRVGA